MRSSLFFSFFFFNDTATTEIYTLSLHDALPICAPASERIEVPRLASPRKARALTVTAEDASPVMGLLLKTSFLPLAITDQPHRFVPSRTLARHGVDGMDPARPGVSMRFIASARLAGVLLAPLRDDGEKSRHAADQPARERQEAGPREFPAGVVRATGGSWTRSVVSASLRSSAPAGDAMSVCPSASS